MTKTSPNSVQGSSVSRQSHPVRSFLVLVFRLLLLGIGGGFAALLGVAIAHFYPASSPSEPFASRLLHQSSQLLQRANRQVNPQPSSITTPGNSTPTAIATARADAPTFTLPSDALFEADQTVLRPDANLVLDPLTQDLQRYPGAVVRVAAHLDSSINVTVDTALEDRTRSLAQAQAVERYLMEALGERYHWVAIGYGGTRPLVINDSPTNQQRNHRVEITVEP